MAESVFNDLVQLCGAFLETASENIITHNDIQRLILCTEDFFTATYLYFTKVI